MPSRETKHNEEQKITSEEQGESDWDFTERLGEALAAGGRIADGDAHRLHRIAVSRDDWRVRREEWYAGYRSAREDIKSGCFDTPGATRNPHEPKPFSYE